MPRDLATGKQLVDKILTDPPYCPANRPADTSYTSDEIGMRAEKNSDEGHRRALRLVVARRPN